MYAFRAARPEVSLTRTSRVGQDHTTKVSARIVIAPPDRIPVSEVGRFHAGMLKDMDEVLRGVPLEGRPVHVRVVLEVQYDVGE